MISVTILIPFPVSFSICSSITSLWFLSCLILFFWWPSLKSSLKSFVFILHDCFSFKSFSFFVISKLLDFSQKYKLKNDFSTKSESSVDDRKHHQPSAKLLIKGLSQSYKHKHDYSTKSEILVDDGWVEVLCRLPLKNIIRCKLVSKSWNRLISDLCIPKFRPPSLYGLYILTNLSTRDDPVFSWDFACIDETAKNSNLFFPLSCFTNLPFDFCPLKLIDCSNGFWLVDDYFSSGLFYVCNPLTKQLISLPRLPEGYDIFSAALIFDPHLSVVCILHYPSGMLIYSAITREWREHRGFHLEEPIRRASWNRHYVRADGCLYCLSRSGHLLEFDVKQVSSRAFQLPEITQQLSRSSYPLDCIGLSNGNLHYAWKDHNISQIHVWTLHDSKWLPKHTITLLPFTTVFKGCDMLTPIAFHPSSDVLFLGHRKEIFGYHPDNKKLEFFYKAKKGTAIDCGHVVTFPFSWNMDTLQKQVEPVMKNQAPSV